MGLSEIKDNARKFILDRKLLNPKNERWRFSPIREFLKFSINGNSEHPFKLDESLKIDNSYKIIIKDGELIDELSDSLPDELIIKKIHDEDFENSDELQRYFGKLIDSENYHFTAKNMINFSNCIYINSKPNSNVEKPIHIVNIQTKNESFPRFFINVAKNSNLSIIERNINKVGNSIQNSVVEILLEENSVLNHICLQEGANTNWNFYNLGALQKKNSSFISSIFSLSGYRNINEISSNLEDEGAEIDLSGLYIADGKSHRDNHVKVIHSSPNTFSKESFKGILSGQSNGVFNGLVIVQQDAQKINSSQSNRNLLLSKDSQMNSNPQLEIYADDVKCSHGSTTGQIDDDALFYMRSRGISESNATKILVKGFAGEIVDKIKMSSIQNYIEPFIENLVSEN